MPYTPFIGLFLPLLGFIILFVSAFKISRRLAGLIGCTSVFISFACFTYTLYQYTTLNLPAQSLFLFHWIPIAGLSADFTLLIDPLSLLMTMIITGVGFLIHVYSIGYMDHDRDVARFFACMNLFIFSMLLLVLAANLLLLFVGWEGVGLVSYLLIGFWYQRPSAAKAATKAFVVNRIGDLGLLLGLILTFTLFGTSDIETISQRVGSEFALNSPILIVLTFLFFIGAIGKSAQIPLHVWLPDAMEGPTPVSALIHAATMVTAGVYLVVRMHPVFMLAPITLHTIGDIGAITALFASLCAVGQTDLKRVLAYSTVSQLGLMFLACGVGAFYAAMFHLTTHAFMKALLFLSAGNVVHMMEGNTLMEKMGGLHKFFPKTHVLFFIGVLAMSGIPPLAAFFSKDMILEQEYLEGYNTLFYIALAASILTAFYLTRAYCLTFFGKCRVDPTLAPKVKEAPMIMLVPVTVLAVLATFGGFLGTSVDHLSLLQGFLAKADVTLAKEEPATLFTPETLLSIIGCSLGLALAALLYTRYADKLSPTWQFLRKSFYIDELYEFLFVRPLEALSRFFVQFTEPKIFGGGIRLAANATQSLAGILQKVQSGQIRSYIAWMAVGMAVLLLALSQWTTRI